SYTVTNSSIIPTEFAERSPYLVYYDQGAINAFGASLKCTQVKDQYNHEKTLKTKEGMNVTYTINDGARFYNIVRKSADDIGVVTLVSGWPVLNDGTTVYIVTATGGGNLATAVYYVSDD
ncbi:MAG: hypothetical protein IJQ98_12780, partial [Oscillospiraceae bacterium]|nr:hypothetical protein [Oscillospiraceae bacterium]